MSIVAKIKGVVIPVKKTAESKKEDIFKSALKKFQERTGTIKNSPNALQFGKDFTLGEKPSPFTEYFKIFIKDMDRQFKMMLVVHFKNYNPEDMKLILTPLVMTVQACRESRSEVEGQVYLRRRWGNFDRSINTEKAVFVMSPEGIVLVRAYWRCFDHIEDKKCLEDCCEEGKHIVKY